MSFPVVAASAHNADTVNSTSRNFTLPSGITAGDLLLVFLCMDGDGTMTLTTSGWTLLADNQVVAPFDGDTQAKATIARKIAVGGETTITVTTSASEVVAYAGARITGHDPSTAPAIGSWATAGSGTSGNPAALSPSWGSDDNLWIAAGFVNPGNAYATAAPANYTGLVEGHLNDFGAGVAVAFATRALAAGSEDPAGFTWNDDRNGEAAVTLAIRPAGAPSDEAPEFTVDPAVTGTPQVGETLTCTDGTVTGTPTPDITKQWQRDDEGGGSWSDISGETGDTYDLAVDDLDCMVRCVVTAENTEGDDTANSNEVGPVEAAPPLEFSIRLSGGSSNEDPTDALGGVESSEEYAGVSGSGDLFPNLASADYSGGRIDYRCVYVHNDDVEDADVVAYVSTQLESGRQVALAVADEASGEMAETIANATTAPSGPSFSAPTTAETGVDMGTIAAGEGRGLWLRRTINSGTDPDASNAWEISLEVTPL